MITPFFAAVNVYQKQQIVINLNYQARDNWIINPSSTAVLLVDVQNSEISEDAKKTRPDYYQRIITTALPNQKRLLKTARSVSMEIIYTVIQSLTRDGRDRSLDHKLSDILIPKGSELAGVILEVAPDDDNIVFSKTSSGVFNSTNIDYVLRNLGIETLIVCGLLTDQCVDMAIRDAADKGYYVICVDDACAAYTEERHKNALNAFRGYCQIMNTNEIIAKLSNL